MSEEIAAADSLLQINAELRRALDVAMTENDGWRELVTQLQAQRDDAQKATAEFDRMRLLACQEVERLAPIARESGQRQADLIFLRAKCDGLNERLAQAERATDAERAARRAFATDAAQLRQAALSYVTSATYEDRERLRAELYVLATVDHPGVLLLNELTLLRELSDDLTRWREAGGDSRDLTYVFETMEKIAQMKAGEE